LGKSFDTGYLLNGQERNTQFVKEKGRKTLYQKLGRKEKYEIREEKLS
jgi:hypothetical protein